MLCNAFALFLPTPRRMARGLLNAIEAMHMGMEKLSLYMCWPKMHSLALPKKGVTR